MSVPETLHELIHDAEETFDSLRDRLIRVRGRQEPVQVLPYRGFGTEETVWLQGRVLENETELPQDDDNLWQNMVRMFKRYESDEVPGAHLSITSNGTRLEVESDAEGYFQAEVTAPPAAADGGIYRQLRCELVEPFPVGVEESKEAIGEVVVPGPDAELLVVSDIDDTVMKTGAADFLKMSRTIFLNNARTRLPFAGVAPFYRALHAGKNPIVYVSSSPWNLYELFDGFLEHHGLPRGPILLKEFGVDEEKLIKTGHSDHKTGWIRRLMEIYPQLPLILIGDSGQQDPWIYREVVLEAPERFRAVYLRDVTETKRDESVREVAAEVEGAGVPMFLVEDTVAAAEHAAENGWISEEALGEIERAREEDRGEPGLLERLVG